MVRGLLFLSLALILSGCATFNSSSSPGFTALPLPERFEGRIPRLSGLSDGLLMSWVAVNRKHSSLMFARYRQGQWSAPSSVANGDNWLVNYADFAHVSALSDEHFVASWLVRDNAANPVDYHFMIAQSFDAGNSWSKPTTPIAEGQTGEHGFVTLQALDDSVLVVWISQDQRNDDNFMVRSARLTHEGQWREIQTVDGMTCSCCHPSMTRLNDRILLAYRDRTPQEVRDIALASYHAGQWSTPAIIHNDGWTIRGCPVQGPSITALQDAYVVSWFTVAKDQPALNMVAILDSGNRVFKQLEGDAASGFTDSARLDSHRAALLWLAQRTQQGKRPQQRLTLQAINLQSGRLSVRVNRKMAQRVIGFPSMKSFQQSLYIAVETENKIIKLLRLNHL